MNTEELRLLTGFLDQLKQVKGIAKDADAEGLIRAAAAQQPDALYLLVQKALLQEQALGAAKSQIAHLQGQLEQARSRPAAGGGFLGSDPWTAPPRPAQSAPGPAAAPAQAGFGSSGFGSFLGTAAATAAGIAGGAFLFQGLESLLGHHGSGSGFLDTAELGHQPVENITINEYYGSDDNDSDDNEPGSDFRDAGYEPEDEGFDAYDDDDDIDSLSV